MAHVNRKELFLAISTRFFAVARRKRQPGSNSLKTKSTLNFFNSRKLFWKQVIGLVKNASQHFFSPAVGCLSGNLELLLVLNI